MTDMKETTEKKLSRWVPVIISFLMSSFTIGVTWGVVKAHIENSDVHMTMEKKMITFVPRTELEGDIEEIRGDVKEIKEMLMHLADRK